MKHLKQFESYFDKESDPVGDRILNAFDNGIVTDTSKTFEEKPAYRIDGNQFETTFKFKIDDSFYTVKYVEYPHRDDDILIMINGTYSTEIPRDSPYRKEILNRCIETIK